MKRKLQLTALIIPLLLAAMLLIPLFGAAAVGEHRYAVRHPSYAKHLCARLLGEEEPADEGDEIPVGGESGVTNVLVLGRDCTAGLTDVMMLVSLDADAHALRVLQIPRDTYAAYTTAAYKKLNGAYAKLGGRGLVEFLNRNMGIPVDRYVCVDLSVFGEIVDSIGGVKIEIPSDMDYDDPAQSLHIHLKAGEQVLDGKQAQMFVRFRSGYATADLGRMDAQKLFLSSLAKQLKSSLTPGRAIDLACASLGKVKTDLSLRECVSCVKGLMNVELDSMHMATLPGASVKPKAGGAWYYILNRAATEQLLAATFGQTVAFDPDGVFNNARKSEYGAIYHASAEKYAPHTHSAEDMLTGVVDIRRIS
jgi:LCP family protein required for cell wall assembly